MFTNEKTIHECNAVKHRQSGQRLNRQSVKKTTNPQDLQRLNINLQPRKEDREDDKEGAALQVQKGKLEDKAGAFLVDPPPPKATAPGASIFNVAPRIPPPPFLAQFSIFSICRFTNCHV